MTARKCFIISVSALLCTFLSSAQTETSLFFRSDSVQVSEIVSDGPDQYKKVGHHGPAVENPWYALRIYFNDSGAIDLYSKSGKQMELRKYLWYPTREQQENEGAGCDEYRVGKTVGLGGIALWDKDHEVKLAAERRTARVGKFRGGAFAEMISYGVPYAGRKVDISVRIEMSDKSRKAKIIASVVSGGRVQFVTGLNYHAGEYVQAGWGAIGTWGIHPADVSENPIEVGAGLEYDPDDYVGIPESLDDMVRLVSKPCRKLVTTVVAASVKEDELNTPEKFFDYLF
jgi:hypothetical protein